MKSEDNKKKEKKSLKEILKNPKSKALIELCFYGVIILIALIYCWVSNGNRHSYANYVNDVTPSANALLNKLEDNNYSYTAEIIKNSDNTIKKCTYEGILMETEGNILKTEDGNETKYYYKDNEYYIYEDPGRILTTESDVYNVLEHNYLDISTIRNYINKGALYNTEDNVKYYRIYLNKILLDYEDSDYIIVDITEKENKVIINIDYTNLMKQKEENILGYNVKLIFSDIGKITSLSE